MVDFNLNDAGFVLNHFDVAMPTGTPSFFFHPSGAVLYKAGQVPTPGIGVPPGGAIEIDDLHQSQFPEPFIISYSHYTNHMLATDDTGRYFFGVTQSGLTMIMLTTIPLSIETLSQVTDNPQRARRSRFGVADFRSERWQVLAGAQVATTSVDEDTLTAVIPALWSGWQDVTVINTNGNSYTFAPGISGSWWRILNDASHHRIVASCVRYSIR